MYPYYETKEMTLEKMKEVAKEKKSFLESKRKTLEND
jgi:hypothetical protein